MARKPTAFRFEEELLAQMDAAVAAGRAKNRTQLIELAVKAQLGLTEEKASGDGVASESRSARRSPGAKDSEGLPCTAAPSSASSRPAALDWMRQRQERLNRSRG